MNIAILSHKSIYGTLKQKYTHSYSYEDIDEINFFNFKNYDYVIIVNLLCYIDMNALKKFLKRESPIFAGLPTYWGIGTHDIAIIHKSLFNSQCKKKLNTNTLQDNLVCRLFAKAIKTNNLSKTLTRSKKNLRYLYYKNKVFNLSNHVYSVNKINAKGQYHNSIFINHTDDVDYFSSWYNEYDTKQKNVFIDDTNHKTIIGLTFFVIQKKHVVLLGKNNFYFWGSNNSWVKINSKEKIFNIKQYVKKNSNMAYNTLRLDSI